MTSTYCIYKDLKNLIFNIKNVKYSCLYQFLNCFNILDSKLRYIWRKMKAYYERKFKLEVVKTIKKNEIAISDASTSYKIQRTTISR